MIFMPMSANVIKRDGRVEAYIPEKIAISCMRAGLKADISYEISKEVSKKIYQNMPTNEIRKLVAKYIGEYDKAAAKKYLTYGERNPSQQPSERKFHRYKSNIEKQDKLSGRPIKRRSRLGKKKSTS